MWFRVFHYPYCQIGGLEVFSLLTICLVVKVPLTSLGFLVGCHNAPVGAGPYRDQFPVNSSVFKQVLLDCHSALFLVEIRAGLSTSELYVEVRYSFIKNASPERWFDFPVPHSLWVEMEVFAKTACQNNTTCEFVTKLGRYR
jgi:hypothetical protein